MTSVLRHGPKWKTLLVVALAATLCQCSNKEGKEKDFTVFMNTKNPLVRITDRKVGKKTIKANWFDFSFQVTNGTSESVRIEEILLYYSLGGVEQPPSTFDLGSLQQTTEDGIILDYVNYCTYPPGITKQFSACAGPTTLVTDPSTIATIPVVVPLTLYVEGLAKQPTGSNVYVMRAELLGVFVDSNGLESSRFTKRFNFTTR